MWCKLFETFGRGPSLYYCEQVQICKFEWLDFTTRWKKFFKCLQISSTVHADGCLFVEKIKHFSFSNCPQKACSGFQRVSYCAAEAIFCWGGTTETTFHYCWRVKSSFKLAWNWFEWKLPATDLSLFPLAISSRVLFCACVHVWEQSNIRNRVNAPQGTKDTPLII